MHDGASSRAFTQLRRELLSGRLKHLDGAMRIELAMLALLVGSFLFWQVRGPLDSLSRHGGAFAAWRALAAILGALALGGAALAGVRHALALGRPAPGPEWLALPIAHRALLDHRAWEARLHALWAAALAPGPVVAAFGLVPPVWILLTAAGFALALVLGARAATAIASLAWLGGLGARDETSAIARIAAARAATRRVRPRPVRWRREAAWLALLRKDLWITRVPGPARSSAWVPVGLGALAAASWSLPLEPPAARVIAFGCSLWAAAGLAEWSIALAEADPYAVLRSLPVGARDLWLGRVASLGAAVAALLASQAAAARPLSSEALRVHLVWLGCAALVIGLLGVHYGLTLFPRGDVARRFLTLTLAIAVAGSLMIPLLGWIVLLTAVLHSARRVPRWARIEVEP